jgi:hypothetical protein
MRLLAGLLVSVGVIGALAGLRPDAGGVAAVRSSRASLPPSTADPGLWVPNGPVDALVRVGETLYVGGWFSRLTPASGPFAVVSGAGSGASAGAPEFAGNTLSRSSGVCGGCPGGEQINAIVGDGSGGWFVGGSFLWVGGVACPALAHIRSDLTLDRSWCGKLAGSPLLVSALARADDVLYVGGFFRQVAGAPRTNLAALDVATGQATDWQPTGYGQKYSLPPISAMAASPSTVFVSHGTGDALFGDAVVALDAATASRLWTDDTYGCANQDNGPCGVDALAIGEGVLYVGGINLSWGNGLQNLVAFDLSTGQPTDWNPDPRPNIGPNEGVSAIVPDGARVYVGGRFDMIGGADRGGIAAVDATTGKATSWNADINNGDFNLDGSVDAAALVGGTLYIAGAFTSAGGAPRLNAAALDAATGVASAWAPDPSGEVGALAAADGKVALGGSFTGLGGVARDHLAAIDLTTGQPTNWAPTVVDPFSGNSINALAVADGKLYVAGWDLSNYRPYLFALDLATGALDPWNPHITGANSNSRFVLNGVTTLAVTNGRLYIGGDFSTVEHRRRAGVAAFGLPGRRLLPFHPRLANRGQDSYITPEIDAIAASRGTVYLGGSFDTLDGRPRPGLGAVDTTGRIRSRWKPPRTGAASGPGDGYGYDLALVGKRLYVVEANDVRVWFLTLDPTTAKILPSLSNILNRNTGHGNLDSVAFAAPYLIVGGWMPSFGTGSTLHGAALLNPTTGAVEPWQPELDGQAIAIADTNGGIIVGGDFHTAGTLAQSYLARFGH